MRCPALLLAASLALAPILSGQGAAPGQAQPAPKPATRKEKKVWTNEDLEELRGKAHVSVVGQASASPAGEEAKPAASGSEMAGTAGEPYLREKDAQPYRERLAPLRAELERIDSQIRQIRDFLSNPRSEAQAGIVLGQGSMQLTPQNQLEQLERRRRDVQQKIDEIEDQARQNGIPPGSLR